MQIQPKTQAQLFQVLVITIFWVLCGAFFAIYKCVTYDFTLQEFIFIVPKHLPLGEFLIINLIGPSIGGLTGGSILVLVLNEILQKKSYWYFLLVNILFFFVFIFTLNTLVSYFFYYKNEIAESGNSIRTAIQLLVLDPYAIRNIITWLIIAFLTLQGLKIYEKYGPGTLFSMFLGKFHRPREVERAFMFLDLSNSTSLAERLGHVQFFALLRDFYFDVTDPVLNSRGEIYQYVGDEVVVAWHPKKAVSEGPDCVACFFRIEGAMHKRKRYYQQKYGIVPAFKAAVHYGTVVVGEIGVIKREIVYSGDILNTTSRMMEQCKHHDQKLIVSRKLIDFISEEKLDSYQLESLGKMPLRGKSQEVEMYGVKGNL